MMPIFSPEPEFEMALSMSLEEGDREKQEKQPSLLRTIGKKASSTLKSLSDSLHSNPHQLCVIGSNLVTPQRSPVRKRGSLLGLFGISPMNASQGATAKPPPPDQKSREKSRRLSMLSLVIPQAREPKYNSDWDNPTDRKVHRSSVLSFDNLRLFRSKHGYQAPIHGDDEGNDVEDDSYVMPFQKFRCLPVAAPEIKADIPDYRLNSLPFRAASQRRTELFAIKIPKRRNHVEKRHLQFLLAARPQDDSLATNLPQRLEPDDIEDAISKDANKVGCITCKASRYSAEQAGRNWSPSPVKCLDGETDVDGLTHSASATTTAISTLSNSDSANTNSTPYNSASWPRLPPILGYTTCTTAKDPSCTKEKSGYQADSEVEVAANSKAVDGEAKLMFSARHTMRQCRYQELVSGKEDIKGATIQPGLGLCLGDASLLQVKIPEATTSVTNAGSHQFLVPIKDLTACEVRLAPGAVEHDLVPHQVAHVAASQPPGTELLPSGSSPGQGSNIASRNGGIPKCDRHQAAGLLSLEGQVRCMVEAPDLSEGQELPTPTKDVLGYELPANKKGDTGDGPHHETPRQPALPEGACRDKVLFRDAVEASRRRGGDNLIEDEHYDMVVGPMSNAPKKVISSRSCSTGLSPAVDPESQMAVEESVNKPRPNVIVVTPPNSAAPELPDIGAVRRVMRFGSIDDIVATSEGILVAKPYDNANHILSAIYSLKKAAPGNDDSATTPGEDRQSQQSPVRPGILARGASGASALTTDSCAISTHEAECYETLPEPDHHRHEAISAGTWKNDGKTAECPAQAQQGSQTRCDKSVLDVLQDHYIEKRASLECQCLSNTTNTPQHESRASQHGDCYVSSTSIKDSYQHINNEYPESNSTQSSMSGDSVSIPKRTPTLHQHSKTSPSKLPRLVSSKRLESLNACMLGNNFASLDADIDRALEVHDSGPADELSASRFEVSPAKWLTLHDSPSSDASWLPASTLGQHQYG